MNEKDIYTSPTTELVCERFPEAVLYESNSLENPITDTPVEW